MKQIYVYLIYYSCYVTDKKIPNLKPIAVFEDVPNAEDFVVSSGDTLVLDRDLIHESSYRWVGDDYCIFTFEFNELVRTVKNI